MAGTLVGGPAGDNAAFSCVDGRSVPPEGTGRPVGIGAAAGIPVALPGPFPDGLLREGRRKGSRLMRDPVPGFQLLHGSGQ